MKPFGSGMRLMALLAAVLLIAALSISENLNVPIITGIDFPNQIKPIWRGFSAGLADTS